MAKLKNINPDEVFTMTYRTNKNVAAKIIKTLGISGVTFTQQDCDEAYTPVETIVNVTIENARSVNNQIQNLLK